MTILNQYWIYKLLQKEENCTVGYLTPLSIPPPSICSYILWERKREGGAEAKRKRRKWGGGGHGSKQKVWLFLALIYLFLQNVLEPFFFIFFLLTFKEGPLDQIALKTFFLKLLYSFVATRYTNILNESFGENNNCKSYDARQILKWSFIHK